MRSLMLSCVAVLVLACGDSGTGGSGAGSDGGNGTGAGNSNGGEGTGAGDTNGGNGTGAGNPNGGNGQGGAGGGVTCTDDPSDTACIACGKDNCCTATTACLASTGCTACVACIEASTDPSDCIGDPCDLSDMVTADTYNCTAASCSTECYNDFDACAASGNDTACTTCAKTSCCPQVEDCAGSASCLNCLDCVGTAADPLSCLGTECDIAFDPPTQALFQCVQTNCAICTK